MVLYAMPMLRYVDDEGRLQVRPLDSESFVIGRAPTCHLTFETETLSREHARIDVEKDGRFRLRDLGSRNRTYVNGELITETLLNGGDIIRAGDRVLEFLDEETAPDRLDEEFLTPDRTEPPHCDWVKVKAPLSLTLNQVEQLAAIGQEQAITARAEDIAAAALGHILLDLAAERGVIALRGEKKTQLRPIAHRGMARIQGGSRMPVSQTFALAPILQGVGGRYPQTAGQIDTKLGYAATAMVAPLVYRGDTIGTLYVDRPNSRKPFSSAALQQIMAYGACVGSMLGEASRRLAHNAPREGLAWMNTLRRIQRALLSEISGSDTFEVSSRLFHGRVRCGDLGDVFHLDEQRCCALIVDGGGHGVTGLTQAHAIRTAIRTAVSVADDLVADPAPLFDALNQTFAGFKARQIIPCTFVGIDTAAGRLAYINAGGAPPLLLVGPGRLVTLDQPALVLGVDLDYTYETTHVDLPDTFRLVCHTDGLIYANNAGGEPLGNARLHEALLDKAAFTSVPGLLSKLSDAWASHLVSTQPDDDALVIVVGRGSPT